VDSRSSAYFISFSQGFDASDVLAFTDLVSRGLPPLPALGLFLAVLASEVSTANSQLLLAACCRCYDLSPREGRRRADLVAEDRFLFTHRLAIALLATVALFLRQLRLPGRLLIGRYSWTVVAIAFSLPLYVSGGPAGKSVLSSRRGASAPPVPHGRPRNPTGAGPAACPGLEGLLYFSPRRVCDEAPTSRSTERASSHAQAAAIGLTSRTGGTALTQGFLERGQEARILFDNTRSAAENLRADRTEVLLQTLAPSWREVSPGQSGEEIKSADGMVRRFSLDRTAILTALVYHQRYVLVVGSSTSRRRGACGVLATA
jgi:hypothetical protein